MELDGLPIHDLSMVLAAKGLTRDGRNAALRSGTMTAMVTGSKTTAGVLSVDSTVPIGDYRAVKGHALTTLFEQAEKLRETIVEKNRQFFHRWRPQNETYLFGFRKHEQGQNAREVPLFEPLVEEQEKEIAELRVPVAHVYEIKKEAGK